MKSYRRSLEKLSEEVLREVQELTEARSTIYRGELQQLLSSGNLAEDLTLHQRIAPVVEDRDRPAAALLSKAWGKLSSGLTYRAPHKTSTGESYFLPRVSLRTYPLWELDEDPEKLSERCEAISFPFDETFSWLNLFAQKLTEKHPQEEFTLEVRDESEWESDWYMTNHLVYNPKEKHWEYMRLRLSKTTVLTGSLEECYRSSVKFLVGGED